MILVAELHPGYTKHCCHCQLILEWPRDNRDDNYCRSEYIITHHEQEQQPGYTQPLCMTLCLCQSTTLQQQSVMQWMSMRPEQLPLPLRNSTPPQPLQALTQPPPLQLTQKRLPPQLLPLPALQIFHPPLHEENVKRSGWNRQSAQTLQVTSPVLRSDSWSSQTLQKLPTMLADSARAVSGAPESTCSNAGAFRMLQDMTYRIVKFWSTWKLCAGRWQISRRAKTAVQLRIILWDQLRALRSFYGRLGATFSQQWFLHNHKEISSYHIHLCYSHKIHYIIIWHEIFTSLYISTYGQSGPSWYWSIIGGALEQADWPSTWNSCESKVLGWGV